MIEKAAKGPIAVTAGVSAKPARQRKARGESPAARQLQQLQRTADASVRSGTLRQLQRAAYLRPHAGALRQLSGVIQREQAHGAYTTNAAARLRNASWPYTVIRELPNGTAVTVIDRGGREENFSLGGVFGEKKHHSWVRLADHTEGWIEDSNLAPYVAPVAAPPVVAPPVAAPPVVAPPPVVAAPAVARLVIADEATDASGQIRGANDKLHTAGLAANVTVAADGGAVAAAVLAITGSMGGGGDVGVSARGKVQNLVTVANNNLYDITNDDVRDRIKWLAYAMTTATHTTTVGGSGQAVDAWRGGGFFDYDKMTKYG